MKVGDKVYHRELSGIATVTQIDIHQSYDARKKKNVVKTKYLAKYSNGFSIVFYGFDIGKKVFKSEAVSKQLSLFDEFDN